MDLFCEKFLKCFDECVTDLMARPRLQGFYLDSICPTTAAYAGTRLIRAPYSGHGQRQGRDHHRREAKRAHAEKVNILCAKDYIMNRTAFKNGADFIAAVKRADEAASLRKGNRHG